MTIFAYPLFSTLVGAPLALLFSGRVAQGRGQEAVEGKVEPTNEKERKKRHPKKSKQLQPDGSPIVDSAKRTKKSTMQAEGGAQGSAPAKSENDPRSETSERRKKKKRAVVVAVEEEEGSQHPADFSQPAASNKARKSTLLMCDNAAAVALGNLLAIQVGLVQRYQ